MGAECAPNVMQVFLAGLCFLLSASHLENSRLIPRGIELSGKAEGVPCTTQTVDQHVIHVLRSIPPTQFGEEGLRIRDQWHDRSPALPFAHFGGHPNDCAITDLRPFQAQEIGASQSGNATKAQTINDPLRRNGVARFGDGFWFGTARDLRGAVTCLGNRTG